MNNIPTNIDDIIDSRDVIARIEELETEAADFCGGNAYKLRDWRKANPEEAEELEALRTLAKGGECSQDWQHGETLIRAEYFTEYAEQLADDIGAIDSDAVWPLNHIDWKAAAEDLQQDYIKCDFDGEIYWIRA